MMGELITYSLIDFIPVTPEVYLRLIVRQNQTVWPAQIITVFLGGFVLFQMARNGYKFTGLLLGGVWLWVAFTYHFQLYANLNWFAKYFGYAFITQALLFCLWELLRSSQPSERVSTRAHYVGKGISTFALIGYPLIGPLLGRSWLGSHLFGISPDATAVGTIGMILLAPQQRWYLGVVPIIWCLISMLQTWALGLYGSTIPLFIAVVVALWAWSIDLLLPQGHH